MTDRVEEHGEVIRVDTLLIDISEWKSLGKAQAALQSSLTIAMIKGEC